MERIKDKSPTLWSKLRHKFENEQLVRLQSAFSIACVRGAEEEPFMRAKGSSFNPRPARIACIIIDAFPEVSTSLLVVAFHSCESHCAESNKESVLSLEEIRAARLRKKIADGASGAITTEEEIICAGLLLDHLRHFHLITDEEKMRTLPSLEFVKGFLGKASPQLQASRLFTLLTFAYTRCVNRLSSNT